MPHQLRAVVRAARRQLDATAELPCGHRTMDFMCSCCGQCNQCRHTYVERAAGWFKRCVTLRWVPVAVSAGREM